MTHDERVKIQQMAAISSAPPAHGVVVFIVSEDGVQMISRASVRDMACVFLAVMQEAKELRDSIVTGVGDESTH